jgi:polyisoprenoid-binding protein YceI
MSLPIPAGEWAVDPSHTNIGFVGRHLGFNKVRGRFTDFTSKVVVGEDLVSSSIQADVDLLSVDTGNADRDGHLKGPDFFGDEENHHMSFVSTKIEESGNDYRMTGDLTIKEKTLPVTFDLEFGGVLEDPWGNTRASFEASAEINRTDFGLNWNVPVGEGFLVSEKIKIELDVEMTQVK